MSRLSARTPAPPADGQVCALFAVDIAGFTGDPTWKKLDFEIDEPSLFSYSYNGLAASFTAVAAVFWGESRYAAPLHAIAIAALAAWLSTLFPQTRQSS